MTTQWRGLLVMAGLAACADTGAVLTPPDPAASRSGSPVIATATGSGHYTSGGELRTLGFSAIGHEDGSAAGEYHVTIHAIDSFFHVSVTCLVVRNDTAWIAGVIDRTNHPAIVPGSVSYFWTVDDGEGPDAVDIVSTARINDAPGEDRRFCTLTPDEEFSGLPGNDIEHGNVQVRSH